MNHKLFLFLLAGFFFNYLTLKELDAQDNLNCTNPGCHIKLMNKAVFHAPIEENCEICHKANNNQHPKHNGNEFSLVKKVPALCYTCHDVQNEKQIVHLPVKEGECLSCHSPHSSSQKFLLSSGDNDSLCVSCHDLEIAGIRRNQCNACHEAHQSDNSTLLKKTSPDLCFYCHEQKKQQLSYNNVHPAFEDDCLSCHLPHNARDSSSLIAAVPELCFNCHDRIESNIEESSNVHGPLTDKGKCDRCHTPHASKYTKLLKNEEQQLCLSCHGEAISTKDRKIKNIKAKVVAVKSIHDPINDEGCGACHYVHTPDSYFLLSASFPGGNYTTGTNEIFALCFDCHDSELLEKSTTNNATNFRYGNQNLHYLHINRKKGRSCIMCHDVHGSSLEHLIATKVKFGKWEMPINFTNMEKGGSCVPGCHEKKIYQR